MEQRPPTSPRVFEYPTRKDSAFRVLGDAKKCVHQYRPPLVGIALPRSAIARPTKKMNIEAKNQDQTIPAGPEGIEYAKVLAMDGSSPIMLNAMPNTSINVKLRLNALGMISSCPRPKSYQHNTYRSSCL